MKTDEGSIFTLTEDQSRKVLKWAMSHKCTVEDVGAIGGRITYQFTPTGLGCIEAAICACGATINVTDFGHW